MSPEWEFIVRLIWLMIGLGLGYAIGASTTALRYTRRMYDEIHECHVMLVECDTDEEDDSADPV
jgi:hypothetical protein